MIEQTQWAQSRYTPALLSGAPSPLLSPMSMHRHENIALGREREEVGTILEGKTPRLPIHHACPCTHAHSQVVEGGVMHTTELY